jgi:hypothetical protein
VRFDAPRIVACLIASPPGSIAPSSAHGASIPAAAFGAPQTIVRRAGAPTSTTQTQSLSAFGCADTASILATTTPENGGPALATSSTSRPAIVSASHSCAVEIGGSQSVRSQRSENFMRSRYANCRRNRRSFS